MRHRTLAYLAVVLVIAALHVPSSLAQCPNAREFGALGGGKTAAKIEIDTSAFQDNGHELARFWEMGNPTNGTGVGSAGTCDSQGSGPVGWWQVVGTDGGLRGIRGFLSQPGCTLPVCPDPGESLTFLIEDQTADGSNAGFIAYTVDDTPARDRWWDLARTIPNEAGGGTAIHPMGFYPTVTIQGTMPIPGGTHVATTDYSDVGFLFHGVEGPLDSPLPASAQLSFYDVMQFVGLTDPGRARSDWTLFKKIAYSDAAIIGDSINRSETDCFSNPGNLEILFLAIGLTWDNSVESELIGPAASVNCFDTLAQPDLDPPRVRDNSFIERRPGRSRR